jgi:hypothetical protein
MRRIGILFAVALAAAPSAFAGRENASFDGAYLGVQTAYGFGAQGDWCGCTFLPPVSDAAGGEGGILSGVQAGFDWRMGSFVAGVGVRGSYADLAFDKVCAGAARCEGKLDWLSEAELRAGVIFGDVLVAGSAGLGLGSVEASAGGALKSSATHDGHSYGLRGELSMSGGWRYGLEYRYYDMGGTNRLDTPTTVASDVAVAWSAHTVGLTIVNEF